MFEITEYRFRPQRGSLIDSLRAQASFTSIEAVFFYVSLLYETDITRVRLSPGVYSEIDSRIGWLDIYTVQVEDDRGVWCNVGFCSWNFTSSFGGCYAI